MWPHALGYALGVLALEYLKHSDDEDIKTDIKFVRNRIGEAIVKIGFRIQTDEA